MQSLRIEVTDTGAHVVFRMKPDDKWDGPDHPYDSYARVLQEFSTSQPVAHMVIIANLTFLENAPLLDCVSLEIFDPDTEAIVPFPKQVATLRSLKLLWISGPGRVQRIPPSLCVEELFADVEECPYWWCDPALKRCYTGISVRGSSEWWIPLLDLRYLVRQGLLSANTLFKQWLTHGLYDPRLLFPLRDFLL